MSIDSSRANGRATPTQPRRGGGQSRGGGRGGHHNHSNSRFSAPTAPSKPKEEDLYDLEDEADEIKHLRTKFQDKVTLAKEFAGPDWSEVDILFGLNDAHGDLDRFAIDVIEGRARKFDSVGTRKAKKDAPASLPSPGPASSVANQRGASFGAERGSRRGFSDSSRGGRGGRGGGPRGGHTGSGRGRGAGPRTVSGHQVNGSLTSGPVDGSTTTPATWAAMVGQETSKDAADTWEEIPNGIPATTADEVDATGGQGSWATEDTPSAPSAPYTNGATEPEATPVEPPKVQSSPTKPAGRNVPVGSKMSWAQIARPREPPKPAPAPPAAPAEVPAAVPVEVPSVPEPEPEPTGTEDLQTDEAPEPQIDLDTQTAPPAPPIDPWAETPAAGRPSSTTVSPNLWSDTPQPAPLGVGEGWAETVLASSEPEQRSTLETSAFNRNHDNALAAQAGLEPAQAEDIGPIVASDQAQPQQPAQQQQQQSAEQTQQPVQGKPSQVSALLAPPGLTKRASQRTKQEAAVVMPSERTPGLDRVGVQFGSLNLFDNASSVQQGQGQGLGQSLYEEESQPQQATLQEAVPQQEEPSFPQHAAPQHNLSPIAQEQPQSRQDLPRQEMPISLPEAPQQSMAERIPAQPSIPSQSLQQQQQHQQQPSQGYGTPTSAFSERYPASAMGYLFQQPQHQHQHQQHQHHLSQSHHQQQQSQHLLQQAQLGGQSQSQLQPQQGQQGQAQQHHQQQQQPSGQQQSHDSSSLSSVQNQSQSPYAPFKNISPYYQQAPSSHQQHAQPSPIPVPSAQQSSGAGPTRLYGSPAGQSQSQSGVGAGSFGLGQDQLRSFYSSSGGVPSSYDPYGRPAQALHEDPSKNTTGAPNQASSAQTASGYPFDQTHASTYSSYPYDQSSRAPGAQPSHTTQPFGYNYPPYFPTANHYPYAQVPAGYPSYAAYGHYAAESPYSSRGFPGSGQGVGGAGMGMGVGGVQGPPGGSQPNQLYQRAGQGLQGPPPRGAYGDHYFGDSRASGQ